MKKIYWQAHFLPRTLMIFICVLSIGLAISVEHFKILSPKDYYQEKLQAAKIADRAIHAIKAARLEKGIAIDKEADPTMSGLIGEIITPSTSDHGVLAAKQASVNPNIAAIVVKWLKELDLKPGDTIAIGYTGSFPALNIAVLAAVKALQLNPIIVASAAASQWGANIPGFLWLDMQNVLNKNGIISYQPVAASLGGIEDNAYGVSNIGKKILRQTIDRYRIPFIESKNSTDGIKKRMQLYKQYAAGAPIKVYINVGGGTASVGKHHERLTYLRHGLIKTLPVAALKNDSVTVRFLREGVPVINLTGVKGIAETYDLPQKPETIQPVGSGKIFYEKQYNFYLTLGALIIIIALLGIVATVKKKVFRASLHGKYTRVI